MSDNLASPTYVRAVGDGLVRRWSTPADADAIGLLLGYVFGSEQDPRPIPRLMAEARVLMRPDFAYMTPYDVAVVEDVSSAKSRIVACTFFWRHRWSYGGIVFDVTRPEIVATHPDFRNRGLARSLFEMIHARSETEGHVLQAITGIAYFYRQFGYEYMLDLEGSRTTYLSQVPEKEGGEPEPCSLRPATLDDVPQIVSMYEQRRAQSLVWHEASDARWRFLINAWDDQVARGEDVTQAGIGFRPWMIVDSAGIVCGALSLPERRYGKGLRVDEFWLARHARLPQLMPALLRALRDHAQRIPGVRPDIGPCTEIVFELGRSHPVYDLLGDSLAPRVSPPYAWYIRIPDVPAFLRLIAPVLEDRLSQSFFTGYTGTLVIDLYREAFELRFDSGRLAGIDSWLRPPYQDDADYPGLGSPPLVFLQLLLGYRSLDELRAIFPDVGANDDRHALINTLFPKQPSFLEPLG
ncbi:MAG: hypothetical protein QOJ13_1913 [Gaiellales bacterium]|nr:hypothetical protein [Gaiellales bacterium]